MKDKPNYEEPKNQESDNFQDKTETKPRKTKGRREFFKEAALGIGGIALASGSLTSCDDTTKKNESGKLSATGGSGSSGGKLKNGTPPTNIDKDNWFAPKEVDFTRKKLKSTPLKSTLGGQGFDNIYYLDVDKNTSNAKTPEGESTVLFGYNGTVPGPTIRVKGSDDFTVILKNSLKGNNGDWAVQQGSRQVHDNSTLPAGTLDWQIKGHLYGPHQQHTTNLHTHGLHVSPGVDTKSQIETQYSLHSDNVLLRVIPFEDFENRVLHGTFDAYMNVAGGLIKGGGPGNKVGNVTLHFAPGEWYIYIGRPEPENRFSIEILGIARMDAYFVMGSVIPDFPAPPDEVSEILGGIDLDFMGDENALADGGGVGFGASFRVDTGNISFLIFYGRFRAGLGFDIMLKNYGDAECKGRGVLGVNGWYASAQAYAYFEGQIGIQIKIFGKRKKIPILEIGAAVVAQAKLPNPTWVRGIVGGYFRALGGLVKGRCKFEITIGEECDLIQKGSVLESIEVLAEITPQENCRDVSVFTVPQAVFNFEMEKEYQTIGYNDEIVKFKIVLEEFSIDANGQQVTTDLNWNDDHTVAVLKPFDVLPPDPEIDCS